MRHGYCRFFPIVIVFIVIAPVGAFAQAGIIGLFADPEGTNCMFDPPIGQVNVYVVHFATGGATACQFSAPKPVCWLHASYVGDVQPMPVTLGDSQSGAQIAYGGCFAGTILVLTIVYNQESTQSTCCYYPVYGHPGLPGCPLSMVDCSGPPPDEYEVPGLPVILYPGIYCSCLAAGSSHRVSAVSGTCPVVATRESTWGSIKSMYGE